jgi:polysaccharide biosynthesis protein PelC
VIQLLGRLALALSLAALPLLTTACSSTVTRVQKLERPRTKARWVLLPFVNHSETPQAGERVEAMLGTLLRGHGVPYLEAYAAPKDDESRLMVGDRQRLEESLGWAKTQKYDFAVTGSVEEWRYKAGIDGEPAVGVTVRIVDLASNRTVWSSAGSRTGSANDNASGTALKLLDTMVSDLELGP